MAALAPVQSGAGPRPPVLPVSLAVLLLNMTSLRITRLGAMAAGVARRRGGPCVRAASRGRTRLGRKKAVSDLAGTEGLASETDDGGELREDGLVSDVGLEWWECCRPLCASH
jgi:hypothetical protein